ncbi:MAG: hypothetical protein MAG795_00632 [Candidatus Woesearchaeota archaeon]|nr:hypothetical protein [Candidatus Woesearchaeota archaeon]
MKFINRLYYNLAKIIPKSTRKSFKKLVVFSGQKKNSNILLGKGIFTGFVLALLSVLITVWFLEPINCILIVIGIFAMTQIINYLVVFFKAEERTKKVESSLPDAFQIVAANLRAGMTPYKALGEAARDDLGPLAEEINYATSRGLGAESFSDILMRISTRIKSDVLDRSLKLFTTAMKSGGNLATLLEDIAADISETHALESELKSSTKTYTAFIMFTIIIGAPLLLAISVNFVQMISDMQMQTSAQSAGFGMGFLVGEIVISPLFLKKVSVVVLILTSVLSSMLLGVINEGEPKSGLKFVPTIMFSCLVVYFITVNIVANFLVGLS